MAHLRFATTGEVKEGDITACDIKVGEKIADGYAIESVFERAPRKPLLTRWSEDVHMHLEAIYYRHLAPPDEINDEDDEEDKREAEQDNRYRQRNRYCIAFGILVLPFVLTLALCTHDVAAARAALATAAKGGAAWLRNRLGAAITFWMAILPVSSPPPPPPLVATGGFSNKLVPLVAALVLGALLLWLLLGAGAANDETAAAAAPPPPRTVRSPATSPMNSPPTSRGPSPAPRRRGDDGWEMNLRDGKHFRA